MNASALTERLHVLVDKPTMKALRAEAKRTGESLGDLTREAVMELLATRTMRPFPPEPSL